MKPEFWYERWQIGQIGFHQREVHASLGRHWRELSVLAVGQVFVPLCGKSLDMLWLRDAGHAVVGVELSAIAMEAFCMENGIPARRRVLAEFDRYEAPNLNLLRGDFFALSPALLGPVSAVYDRAALISWVAELRAPYVEHLARLIAPGIETLLVTVEYPQEQMSGPPFSIDREEVRALYSRYFAIQELYRCDVLASEPRLRARGLNCLVEVCYRLRRSETYAYLNQMIDADRRFTQ